MRILDIRQQIPPLGAFVALCMTEALVAAWGTRGALSHVPLLLAAIDFVQGAVPVARRFAACAGPEGTTGAVVALSAIFLPLKVLVLFAAFPFRLQDTDQLWSGHRADAPGIARGVFLRVRRMLLLGLCAVPVIFVFVGFADDIDTGRALEVTLARHRRFCQGGLAAYPQWLMYSMFATVPCLAFAAAANSLWHCRSIPARTTRPEPRP
jgi:hypothetical protein